MEPASTVTARPRSRHGNADLIKHIGTMLPLLLGNALAAARLDRG